MLAVLIGGCAKPAAPQKEAVMPATTNRFTGTLHGGVIAIGGDTTGWQLERDDNVPERIDVNVSKVQDAAQKLDGQRVVIEGNIASVNWVERGRKQLLMAERIEPAPAPAKP
jgi:hypothetical protein